jgi:MFS family permease
MARMAAPTRDGHDATIAAARAEARPRAHIFHGWWIVLVAFVCFGVNTGLIFYAWGVFLTPLALEFGGRGRVSGAYSCMQIASAAYGLWLGRVVDRRGARPVQIAGALALATGYVLMSRVHSLPQLYLCLAGPIALGSTCVAGVPNNAAVARWFVRKRGRALGISTAGISAGGILFTPLAQQLNDHYGWRVAYAVLGVAVALILLPPVIAFSRRDPADMGLLPDGEAPPPTGESHAGLELYERELERSVRPEVAVRQANFWLLAAAFGLTMAGLASVLLYQIPLMIDRGMPAQRASLVLGATAAMGVVGKLGFGALLDRFDQRRVAAVCFCLQAAGVGLLMIPTHDLAVLVCYVVLYGYAMGGNATLVASLTGETFGRLHYGAISGRLTPFVVLAQAFGIPTMGYVRDVTGSYVPAMIVIILGAFTAAGLVLQVRLPHLREAVPSRTDP